MASVFLSYDREDTAAAGSVARALEKAGHSVWWDRQIAGGAQYEAKIEEALGEAEAVVVLWSSGSVKSAWVKDEAASGRDAGKLVPARLDNVEPPLGFRQYQTIDLSRWNGRAGSGPLKALLHGIQSLKPGNDERPATVEIRPRRVPRWGIAAAMIGVILLAVAAWFLSSRLRPVGAPIVAVAAADSSADSAAFARDLFVKLGRLQAAKADQLQLVEARAGNAKNATFVFEVGGQAQGPEAGANLVLLSGADRRLLWSRDFEQVDGRTSDLRNQAAYTAARVLDCALEGSTARRPLEQSALKLYLNGCSALAEFAGAYVIDSIPAFLTVTRSAPRFEGGWAKLVLAESQVAANEESGGPTVVPALRKHMVAARKLNPDMAELAYAEIELLPKNDFSPALELSEKAAVRHPEHPFLLRQHAGLLLSVGRMGDAVTSAERAAAADPLSPVMRSDYIAALAYSGRIEEAIQELAEAEKLWPGSFAMLDAGSRIHARYGDPEEALRIGRINAFRDSSRAFHYFILARKDPTPANIDRAIAQTKAEMGRDRRGIGFLIQAYGEFDRNEPIFKTLLAWQGSDLRSVLQPLFRPTLKKFRQDPRFMVVARRFRLIDYWQKSGKWPDFCFESDLPYDCRAEAAKLSRSPA